MSSAGELSSLTDPLFWGALATIAALVFAPAVARSAWIWCKEHPSPLSWRDIPLALLVIAICIVAYGNAGYVAVRDFVRGR